MNREEKERRIIRSVIPPELRGEALRKAIHDFQAERGLICGPCGEWPEYCDCVPCCCPESMDDLDDMINEYGIHEEVEERLKIREEKRSER